VREPSRVHAAEHHADRLAEAVHDGLERRSYTLSALESCTGGLVSSILTDVPGAGRFMGGGVAYSPEAKCHFGVPQDVMQRHGLVSCEVALAMAKSAARWFGTDVGVGITGVAGPGSEDGVPEGTGFAAVWSPVLGERVLPILVDGDRKAAKAEMAGLALGLLLEVLEETPPTPHPAEIEGWIGR
jgi:nicotinamide-nucleotide amidase